MKKELEKQKIETLGELPWHNGMLYQHASPEDESLLYEKHSEEQIEFELFSLLHPMPIESFLALPESAPFELHFNQPVFMPAPTDNHQKISFNLILSVGGYVDEHELGEFRSAPYDVHLPEKNIIQPDLLFVAENRTEHIQKNGLHTGPDWAAEILSPSTRKNDEGLKLQLLSDNGTVEYWIIHPEEKWVEQYIFDEESEKLLLHKKYEDEDDVIESIVITGFSIMLKKIFKGTKEK
jgi:Uma2 family endonuclease